MEELPSDIALDILSRLPINSLLQIKCVCKAWRALAQDPRLPHLYHARASDRNPCLLFQNRDDLFLVGVGAGTGTDDYNIRQVLRFDSRLMMDHPMVLHNMRSCNGLICVSMPLHFDIFNPFTGNHIELPKKIGTNKSEWTYGFGYHPTTKEYKVVQMVQPEDWGNRKYQGYVRVSTLSTSVVWSSRTIEGRPPRELVWAPSEVLFNDCLHWLSAHDENSPSSIVSFDLSDEKFRQIPGPTWGYDFHLEVFGGCLSAVFYEDDGQVDIWVMKEYNVEESWTKDIIIGACPFNDFIRPKPRPRIVCILKNGDVLLQYGSRSLVTYNPESEEFKELVIPGLPEWFYAVVHVESLFPVEEILQIDKKKLERYLDFLHAILSTGFV